VAALVVPTHRSPPAIYRAARALRWLSVIVLIVLIIFAGTVAYSAVEVARSSPQSRGFSASFGSNGTVVISGSFSLSNAGLYPIQGFELAARITNGTGAFLGTLGVGPTDIAPSSTADFPVALYLAVSANSPAVSLLTRDQYLGVSAWANATYAYLFPLSVTLTENRAWGAPFENFHASLGTPSLGGGGVTVPVTVTFSNHASFTEAGTLSFIVQSSSSVDCGGATFPLNVPPGTLYDQTSEATLSSGCSPAGGELLATFTNGQTTLSFPPEAIP